MTILEIILSITTTLLGGVNLVQLLLLKHTKAKAKAETESIQIAALQQVIKTMQQEITRLNDRVLYLESKLYNKPQNKNSRNIVTIKK